MNRRPWPLVIMAFLQFVSPLIYICVAAAAYQLTPSGVLDELMALTSDLRKFELFVLPLILGALILFTRKAGYYLVIAGTTYLIIRGVMVFVGSNETDPIYPTIISNLLCLVVVVTLLKSTNRSVYFNPRLRWWETSPRFVVSLAASLTRVGAKPIKALLQNVAVGGAGIEVDTQGFLINEIVDIEFQNAGETYRLKSKIVWEKTEDNGKQILGVQWADENSNSEWSKIRRLARGLKSKDTKTTRSIPPRMRDVREWFSKISG